MHELHSQAQYFSSDYIILHHTAKLEMLGMGILDVFYGKCNRKFDFFSFEADFVLTLF
jgi:hypothetical protein